MIPEQFIDELIARADIADVVGDYVHLTPKGGNIWGLCPFHAEKTPSFSVNRERQIYKCFGCGKGGGAINFIMEIENLSYPEAIRFLAKRLGMEVPEGGLPVDLGLRPAKATTAEKRYAGPWRPTRQPPDFTTAIWLARRGRACGSIWPSGRSVPNLPPDSVWGPRRGNGICSPRR
mgnify:CR=1 FL=1